MERKNNYDDFEHYLQENADQVRMSPSSAVWKNIAKDLNRKRRRWFAVFATLLVTISAGGYLMWNTYEPASKENAVVPASSIKITPLPENKTTAALPPSAVRQNILQGANKFSPKNDINPVNPLLEVQLATLDWTLAVPTDLSVTQETEQPVYKRFTGAVNNMIELQKREDPGNSLPVVNTGIHRTEINTAKVTETTDLVNAEKAEEITANIQKKERKLDWQLFFSPNISYRKLSENKPFSRPGAFPGATLNYLGLYDVNNAVTHKPDIGFEFGVTTKYAATQNLKLRAGFQFNINRYDIKAFSYVPEVATIALNNGYGVDLVNTISNYRNFNGGKTNWLQNYYFQASVPLGAEVKVTGNDKMHVGVATTLQPTYVIGDRAYLITNDYKNYAELPWLIRRWNVNTNLETFVSYSTGKTKWQIGPQVRYQLLSSFVSKYPVKENLFDFGLKVGVTLNNR